MSKRQLKLNTHTAQTGDCVFYVMSRDQRVHDNHALLLAQQSALEAKVPLVVMFNLYKNYGVRSKEHYAFMIDGLKQLEQSLAKINIEFFVVIDSSVEKIVRVANDYKAKELFFDFSPLRGARNTQKQVAKLLDIPCSVVDTHNIIPIWVLSDKEEFAAHTIRRKVHKNLKEWVVEPEKVTVHPFNFSHKIAPVDWADVDMFIESVSPSGITIQQKSGESAANESLADFIEQGLHEYAASRNVPTEDGQSNLSPYLHFGQISALRVALDLLAVSPDIPLLFVAGKLASYKGEPTRMDSINALLEELIVRKELADNFCFYNDKYDSIESAKDWAKGGLERCAS